MDKTVAIDLLFNLLTNSAGVSALLQKAHSEGRTITKEELQTAIDQDDQARNQLEAAIGRAQQKRSGT